MKRITILIPCHNEEKTLPVLYERLREVMSGLAGYAWEVLLVNDGSTDGTLSVMRQMRLADDRVCWLDLSRNFGKERAMLAGFDHATGDCVIVIDADLQDPPELIAEMVRQWEDGYDDVYAKRNGRGKESWLRRKLSLAYYRLLQQTSDVQVLENVGDFRLLDRKCVEALKLYREQERYTKGMFCAIGFKKKEITFDRGDRAAGKSSFNLLKLTRLAMDGITSHSIAPLRIATVLGLVVSLFTFFYAAYFLIKTWVVGDPVQGFPTLIVVILFLGGVQLLSLGIIGEYIGRIFIESKHRPVYHIREKEGV